MPCLYSVPFMFSCGYPVMSICMKVPINYLHPECKHEQQRIFAKFAYLQKFAAAHACTPGAFMLRCD